MHDFCIVLYAFTVQLASSSPLGCFCRLQFAFSSYLLLNLGIPTKTLCFAGLKFSLSAETGAIAAVVRELQQPVLPPPTAALDWLI